MIDAADLIASPERTITRESPFSRYLDVFERDTKLSNVHSVMFWDDRPGCVVQQCGGHPCRFHPFTYRTSYDIRLVFDLSTRPTSEAEIVLRHYAWCPVVDVVLPPKGA